MALPIRHRIDHVMTYISPSDGAWDYTRIAREKRLIAGDEQPAEGEVVPWQSEDEHPITQYRAGAARYDLATVREYLLPDVVPVEFKLRRATLRQYAEICEHYEAGRGYIARLTAIAFSLDSVSGLDFKPRRRKHSDPIEDEKLDELRYLIGDTEFYLLGVACSNANAPLSEAEGKR